MEVNNRYYIILPLNFITLKLNFLKQSTNLNRSIWHLTFTSNIMFGEKALKWEKEEVVRVWKISSQVRGRISPMKTPSPIPYLITSIWNIAQKKISKE